MEKITIKTKNDFTESFEKFQSSNLFDRLRKKFEVKPFFERYKTLRAISAGSSYFINFFSVITAFTCVFVFLDSLIQIKVLSGIIAVILLAGIEAFKRLTIPDFFKTWFQFSKVNIFKLCCIVGLAGLSMSLSFMGANDAVKMMSPPVTLQNIDSITAPGKARITELEKRLKDIKRTQSWRGKLTAPGQKAYNETATLISKLQEKVIADETRTGSRNDDKEKEHTTGVNSRAWIFAIFTLILDSLLLLLLWFLEYYDFRSLAEFATTDGGRELSQVFKRDPVRQENHQLPESDKKLNGSPVNEARMQIKGFFHDDRNNDNRTDQVIVEYGKGTCLNCGNTFIKNARKHVYCSDECRVIAWESRTGKNLKRVKGGII